MRAVRTLGVDQLLALGLGCIVLVAAASVPINDPDLGWQLKTGQQVWEHGWPPATDPFSYTVAGRPWVAYSWLADLLLWIAATAVGFHAVVVLCAGLVAATFVVVYGTAREYGASPPIAWVMTLFGAAATWLYASQRPAMASFLLAAVVARTLSRERLGRPARLWTLVPVMALWANLHVFFVFGLAWIWATALWSAAEQRRGRAREWRRLALVAVACSAVTLCTPYGIRLATHVLAIGGQPASLSVIVEHTSPDFHGLAGFLLLPLLLSVVAAMAVSPERPDPFLLALVLVHTALALYMRRNTPLLAIVAVPVAARAATAALGGATEPARPPTPLRALVHGLAAAALLAMTIACLPANAALEANLHRDTFPVAAVRFLRTQPPLGRMLNGYNWGGFLIWELYPGYRVSIDSRSALYGTADTLAYLRLHFARDGWRQDLERIHPDFILWERGAALATALEHRPDWVAVYEDDVAVIFVRADHPLRAELVRAARRAAA